MPEDLKNLVRYMTYCFYSSWAMFPILFVVGPEGFGHITPAGSVIGHTIADLLSKNLWGMFDWWLEYNIKMRAMSAGDDDDDSEAGAYTPSLFSSTSAASHTKYTLRTP